MNGHPSQEAMPVASIGTKKSIPVNESQGAPVKLQEHLTNGIHQANGEILPFRSSSPLELGDLPLEVRQQFQGAFMPLAGLVRKSAQDCWNKLSEMVEELALPTTQAPESLTNGYLPNGAAPGGQSKSNLDKKDRLLNFANDQRANFIKLLVLLQWSKDAEDVSKALQISFWLHQQRQNYFNASYSVGLMKRQLASFQVPNPDLRTAATVLALKNIPELPDLGYVIQKPLAPRQMLRSLNSLNRILASRLAIADDLPEEFQDFRIHDGRATFNVADEFELDLTVMDADPTSRFHFLDFRFNFSPSSDLPQGVLHNDLSFKINDLLGRDGLVGCFDFLHEMVLSYKLSILHKQAVDLSRGQYANNLRVELIRRTLVVQYWTNRPASKSWIEIGIKSGRRKPCLLPQSHTTPYLHARWIRELKEAEDTEVVLDVVVLSMEAVLVQTLALHSCSILDLIHDKIITIPAYANGELGLEQTSSLTDPGDCRLILQLTKTRQTSVALEPATGALILSPATALSSRVEQDMRQSKKLAEDVSQRLSQLRSALAELDLLTSAECAGWDVVRAFKLSQAEIRSLFGDSVSRVAFLRQPSWETEHMLAAIHGPQGDYWWLIQRAGGLTSTAAWSSQRIDSRPMHAEDALSYAYFARLADYASGMISLQANATCLASIGLQFVLGPMPRFDLAYQLPKLSLDFQPAKLRPMLSIEPMTADFVPTSLDLSAKDQVPSEAWIRRTVILAYTYKEQDSDMAGIMARGAFSAKRKVLQQLADAALDPLIQINSAKKTFSIRLSSPVGKPIIEQLLRQLSHLENVVACVSVIQKHHSLSIVSLSSSHLSLRYEDTPGNELGFTVHFASSTSRVQFELWPRKSNPHIRISTQLTEVLTDPRRSLPANLRLLIPLLTFTLPLLSLFQELQAAGDNATGTVAQESPEVRARLYIMPRHATMYGIHYLAPPTMDRTMPVNSEGSPRMLARLEILPSQRPEQSYWILRPAIEEFETYTRPSFSMEALNVKMKEEIFSKVDGENGWIALDQGAACPIDKPRRLLMVLNELITKCLNQGSLSKDKAAAEDGTAQETEDTPAKQQAVARAQSRAPAQQKTQPDGTTQVKPRAALAAGKGNAQKKQEVIQLD